MQGSERILDPMPSLNQIGEYKLLGEVGRGGMGVVYKASAPDGGIVAVKVLHEHYARREVERGRFFREAQLARRLDHPNLVRAYHVGEEAGRLYFAMEYVEGITLGQHLTRVGRLKEDEAIRVMVAVARGLERAHEEGLIHRDIKPENVFLTVDGRVKLLDLGLAKELDTDLELTRADRGLGTPVYMAPEQFRDAARVDIRCDIYGLGQTLYVALTGHVPFSMKTTVEVFLKKQANDFPSPRQFVPSLRESTVRVVCLAMDADPNRRPQTVAHFIRQLVGDAPAPSTEPAAVPPIGTAAPSASASTKPLAGPAARGDSAVVIAPPLASRPLPVPNSPTPSTARLGGAVTVGGSAAAVVVREPATRPTMRSAKTPGSTDTKTSVKVKAESEFEVAIDPNREIPWKVESALGEEFARHPFLWLDLPARVFLLAIAAFSLAGFLLWYFLLRG
jgi:serine/threonine protein kinase